VSHGHAAIAEACGKLGEFSRAEEHLGYAYAIRRKIEDERGLCELKCLGETLNRLQAEAEAKAGGPPSLLGRSSSGKLGKSGSDSFSFWGAASKPSRWRRAPAAPPSTNVDVGSRVSDATLKPEDLALVRRVLSGRAQTLAERTARQAQQGGAVPAGSFFDLVLAARTATADRSALDTAIASTPGGDEQQQQQQQQQQSPNGDSPGQGVRTGDVEMAVPSAAGWGQETRME
jgi:hypothetical protein